ncbi:nicotinate mononucleotide-dependent phosphoribosyltransferase CobT [Vulcanococcus limneticus]|uniref:nicotinate mononucleotide-dependent phosphoribosyltransferase CobT n=1 Tax=Vulcanococcus limneticus TaxID=2170428 RepID=UPI00398BE652
MALPRRLSGDPQRAEAWCAQLAATGGSARVLLLLAGTDTAAVSGISAAGATPESRRWTAAADAELLLLGPAAQRPHALPPLPAGVTPALIAQVVVAQLGLDPLVVDLGAPVAPAIPHLRLVGDPARCLSGGQALEPQRVERLLALGRRWGAHLARQPARPLLLAECVPGGTTTAQAVLTGLGLPVQGLVSGSLRTPAHALKAELVARGLAAAGLPSAGCLPQGQLSERRAHVLSVLAAVGDPMQVLAAALALEAGHRGVPVLLAGGSQMAAVLALALALAAPEQRPRLAASVAIGTTAWVAGEAGSDLVALLERIGRQWSVEPLAFAAGLRFGDCARAELRDYERGYVKEGVGAGGLALLWELLGRSPQDLAAACDRACSELLQADRA